MCGLTGFWTSDRRSDASAILAAMTASIAHRGPDDSGVWLDAEAGIALGHRRLAIIDVSAAGHQPMHSASGRYIIVYNGEIYNHHDLRRELEAVGAAPSWRGHSDTEVLLAAIDHWGFEQTLERANGMFALALWDRQRRVLTLARDRLGEKPLYYGRAGEDFVFGSELKALARHPKFERQIDRAALTEYFRYAYVPAPRSIWQRIGKLPPAHFVEIRDNGRTIGQPTAYWDFAAAAAHGAANPVAGGTEALETLDGLLKDAVLRRMEADVPLGSLLSGGIDSSLIAALMQAQSARPVRTFTIGFDDPRFNEARHAKAVAEHLGTDHTELYVTAQDALDLLPRLPSIWDEPFADSSQMPTYLVSALTRRHVTVCLSGDGGDELFGGYNRYAAGMRLWTAAKGLPGPVRGAVARALQRPGAAGAADALMRLAPSRHRQLGLADRLPRLGQAIGETSPDGMYRRLVSQTMDPEALVLNSAGDSRSGSAGGPQFDDFRQRMMYLDTLTYLPDDILVKVDRAGMAVSLEGRIPFLDHRVVEYAWQLPMSEKVREGTGKHILRELLYRYVPKALVERPKMGFAVPVETWLRTDLRDWAEELLAFSRVASEGFLNPHHVQALWSDFIAGRRRTHVQLWTILMFQAWLEASRSDTDSVERLSGMGADAARDQRAVAAG
ncbi:MAG: asparagine synthase (glutamine-hydrolyzing) [Sphingomonas sp.]|uniref:asparagine synthase (glutamine-hydrolyzing) n=1 Tax=Sphingomonas sp. TaxID=28214 RepID=UPI001B1CAAE2|nr:asparagine synthase (glutamine-hydrolyzing) [Sphingomonas sp.]MBO9622445.1 asparagine synthase (glutamine-hydrolyzing) [Sphingomonas sp.]